MSVENRQHQVLEHLASISTDTRIPFRSQLTKHTALLLLKNDTASSWFSDSTHHILGEWEGLLLTGVYYALQNRPTFQPAEKDVRNFLLTGLLPWWRENYEIPNGLGSENHVLVKLTVRYLLEQLAGETPPSEVREQIILWCREKALRGHTEYFSPHYTERAIIPLLELYDYAQDDTLHTYVHMALDQYMAEHALIHINGFRGGAMRRYYQWHEDFPHQELNNAAYDCNLPLAQILFDNISTLPLAPYKSSDHHIGFIFYATTSYRVSASIQRLSDPQVRGTFAWRSGLRWNHDGDLDLQRPNAFFYGWITPHYVLSSIRCPQDQRWGYVSRRFEHGTNRGLPWRLSLPDPRTMLASKRKGPVEPENGMCDPEDTRTLFQHRNTVIYVGKSDTLKNMNPPIPENEGFLKEEMDGEYGFLFSPGSNGEMVYAGVYETNGLGVLEVKLKSEIESFDTFKSSFKAAPKTLLSPEDIDLQTLSDDHIVIHTEGITVNNHSIPLADWPRYDAPWIHADWMHQSEDAGKITIGTPEQGLLTLDFRTPDRRVYIQNAIH